MFMVMLDFKKGISHLGLLLIRTVKAENCLIAYIFII